MAQPGGLRRPLRGGWKRENPRTPATNLTIRPTWSDSSKQASSKPGAVQISERAFPHKNEIHHVCHRFALKRLRDLAEIATLAIHPSNGIRKAWNKALWMVRGKVRMFGPVDDVMDTYAYDRAMNHRSFIFELLRHLAANKAFARLKAELRGRR